jgi:hypothetical protein
MVQFIQKIIQNNPQAVYLNLVNQGLMSPGGNPSVGDIIGVIELQLSNGAGADFLLRTFNVVVNANGLYAAELADMTTKRGKNIQMILIDELAIATDQQSPFDTISSSFSARPPQWLSFTLAILAMIGLLVLIYAGVKAIGRIFK